MLVAVVSFRLTAAQRTESPTAGQTRGRAGALAIEIVAAEQAERGEGEQAVAQGKSEEIDHSPFPLAKSG